MSIIEWAVENAPDSGYKSPNVIEIYFQEVLKLMRAVLEGFKVSKSCVQGAYSLCQLFSGVFKSMRGVFQGPNVNVSCFQEVSKSIKAVPRGL